MEKKRIPTKTNPTQYSFEDVEWEKHLTRAIKEHISVGLGHDVEREVGVVYNVPVLASDAKTWYHVRFIRPTRDSVEGMVCQCNCQAGKSGRACKHVAKAAAGRGWLIPSPEAEASQPELPEVVRSILKGTKSESNAVEEALRQLK